MGSKRQERSIQVRKGHWIEFPFEPCWNEYWLYASDLLVQEPLLHVGDIAAHLWLCSRYHPAQPQRSAYLWTELAAVWYGDTAKWRVARRLVKRLERVGLVDVLRATGRAQRTQIVPYDPLAEDDFKLASAQGVWDVPAQPEVRQKPSPAALAAFNWPAVRRTYRVDKPRNFQRRRGWEPCLHACFALYLGFLGRAEDEYIGYPAPFTWEADLWAALPPAADQERLVVRLVEAAVELEDIALALWMRKQANQARLQRVPWVEVSLTQFRRRFHVGWPGLTDTLARLERVGLVRGCGGGRGAGANKANVPHQFLLWDPCESLPAFLAEIQAGEIQAVLTPLGQNVAAALGLPMPAGLIPGPAPESIPFLDEGGAEAPAGESIPFLDEGGAESILKMDEGGAPGQPEKEVLSAGKRADPAQKGYQICTTTHDIQTEAETTTKPLPVVVVDLFQEVAIPISEIPAHTSLALLEEMARALSEIVPGDPGYDSRARLVRDWLGKGPAQAVLSYLAAAAGMLPQIAQQQGFAALDFAYVREVVMMVWTEVHGTRNAKHLASRVFRWLQAQTPLPESWLRRGQSWGRARAVVEDTGPEEEARHPVQAELPVYSCSEREAYLRLLGRETVYDQRLWQRLTQEVARVGLTVPDWFDDCFLDATGPDKTGHPAEVWFLYPATVSPQAVAEALGADGLRALLEQVARTSRPQPVQVSVSDAAYPVKAALLTRLRQQARNLWALVKQDLRGVYLPSDYGTWVDATVGLDVHYGYGVLVVGTPLLAALTWWRKDGSCKTAAQAVQQRGAGDWRVRVEMFGRVEQQTLEAAITTLSPATGAGPATGAEDQPDA